MQDLNQPYRPVLGLYLHIRRINNGSHSNHSPDLHKKIEYIEHYDAILMTVRLLFGEKSSASLRPPDCAVLEHNTDIYIVSFISSPSRYTLKTTDKRLNDFMEVLTAGCV